MSSSNAKHASGTSTYLQAHKMSDNYQHKERKRNLERKAAAYSSGGGGHGKEEMRAEERKHKVRTKEQVGQKSQQ